MNLEEAKNAASWCLNCKLKPCSTKGCPMETNIPEFISEIKKENLKEAFNILQENNIFSYVCSVICPQEEQCEGSCIRGIKQTATQIGALEKYVNRWARENNISPKISKKEKNGRKVAIIGAGPAGLECAVELLKAGFEVDIFEKDNKAGGILNYGIPDFRLPKEVVKEIKNYLSKLLKDLGFTANIEVKMKGQVPTYTIYSDKDGLLIGKNGKNLHALSIVVGQYIKKEIGESYKFLIDINDYKEKHERALVRLAKKVAKEVAQTKIEAKMDSMNSYERRIIHNALTNNKKVYTESEGEEPNRYVVIKPKEEE